ncbi:MAG TPA: hypothetical protein VF401_00205 [Candidatus Saccharimonadales bacterium]
MDTALSQQNIGQIGAMMAAIIKETVPDMIREGVSEGTASLRKEVSDLREDVQLVRRIQANQSVMMRTMQTSLTQVTETNRHLGILYEQLHENVTAQAQILSDHLGLNRQVQDHEDRLQQTEATQKMLLAAVTDHSRQLKSRGSNWYTKGDGRTSKRGK